MGVPALASMPAEQAARPAAKLPVPFLTTMDPLHTVIEMSNSLDCTLGPRVLAPQLGCWTSAVEVLQLPDRPVGPGLGHANDSWYISCLSYVFECVGPCWISHATLLRAATRKARVVADLRLTPAQLHEPSSWRTSQRAVPEDSHRIRPAPTRWRSWAPLEMMHATESSNGGPETSTRSCVDGHRSSGG